MLNVRITFTSGYLNPNHTDLLSRLQWHPYTPSQKIGTPTGNLQFQIYASSSGTLSLLGTTDAVPSFNNSSAPTSACFESPVIISANTTIRVVMSETSNSNSSANSYRTYYMTYDSGPGARDWRPSVEH